MAVSPARRHAVLLFARSLAAGIALARARPSASQDHQVFQAGVDPAPLYRTTTDPPRARATTLSIIADAARIGAAVPAAVTTTAPQADTRGRIGLLLDHYRSVPAAAVPPRLSARDLSAFFRDLKSAAPDWIRADGSADEPRRRLAVATYVLDLANAQNEAVWQPLLAVSSLIDWAGGVLRGSPPRPAERDWYIAAAALLELSDSGTRAGPGVGNPLIGLLDHANDRFRAIHGGSSAMRSPPISKRFPIRTTGIWRSRYAMTVRSSATPRSPP